MSAAPVPAASSHLDLFLPRYDFASEHAIPIRASAARTYAALTSASMADAPLARVLLRLRGYGTDSARRPGEGFPDHVVRHGFIKLNLTPPQEMVFGIVGQFWRPDGCIVPLTAREFVLFSEEGYAKAAWNLAVHELDPQKTLLTTETRIQVFGRRAKLRFGAYWTAVRPFSGLVRRSLLRRVKALAESA